MNLRNRVNNELSKSRFFRIDNFVMEYYKEFEKEMKTNKPIHLKPTNWEEHKETFYNQQIDIYKDEGISKDMIIEEELEILESLIFIETKHKRVKKLYTQLLNEKLKSEQANPEQTKKQIKFKPTDFNRDGFELFNYLIENYADLTRVTGQQKRLSNLWHFMKNDNKKTDIYKFYFTKNRYKEHILEEYKIKITNTDKSPDKYPKEELPILNNLLIQFEDMKKE
jgi:hypothetical protein